MMPLQTAHGFDALQAVTWVGVSDLAKRQSDTNSSTFASLPTAGGGISRAAYAAAIKARLDVDRLLQHSGLTTRQIRDPEMRIPVRNQIRFLDAVAGALQDDFLGVHLAEHVELRELGLLYYVLASSDTLANALVRASRYSTLQNEGVQISFQQSKHIIITFDYISVSRASDRHQIEFFVVILLRLCRELTARRISPSMVKFTHRRGDIPADIRVLLACPVKFGATVDEVTLPLDASSIPIMNADPYLNALLLRYCEEAVSARQAKGSDWRSRVENVIAPLLPHGEATIDKVAQRVGLSRRTLARRLSAENITFLEVLNELRLNLAKQYLRERDLKVTQIAWLLGYREVSAFTHALKRWTGQSPAQLRSRIVRTDGARGFK
jgi:AraC-like DNA-binding protein